MDPTGLMLSAERTQKYSIQRHIQNLHDENGQIVSFVDYLAGRRTGIYPQALPPTYIKKSSFTSSPKPRLMDILQNESLKAMAWRAVDMNSSSTSSGGSIIVKSSSTNLYQSVSIFSKALPLLPAFLLSNCSEARRYFWICLQ